MSHQDNQEGVQRYYGQQSSHDHYPQKTSYDKCRKDKHSCPPRYKKHHCPKPDRGPRGPKGCDGKDGRHGCDGKDGRHGCDGEDGEDGRHGVDGKDGRHGCDGEDGQDGCDGEDGRHGDDGKDGDAGDEGAIGMDGIVGAEGPQGPPGKAGCKHASKFIITVSQDGHCDFDDLCEALKAAHNMARDELVNSVQAITIIVFPGEYKLCDMKNLSEINIIGKGTSQHAVRVYTDAGEDEENPIEGVISYGNKSWTGITFVAKKHSTDQAAGVFNGGYILNSADGGTHVGIADTFCKCIITDNFRFRVINNRMKFRNCFFNYFSLVRDKVIFIEGGSISICYCKFFVCRATSAQGITTFMSFEADSTLLSSVIIDCHFRIIIDGSEKFYIFNIKDTQFVAFCNTTFNWIKSQPAACVLFGTNTGSELNPIITKAVKILVNGCKSYYNPDGGTARDQGVIITSDLWTGSQSECIVFVDCYFQAAKLVVNKIQPAPNLIGCWHMERVTFISTHTKFPAWVSTVDESNDIYITLRFCSFTVRENIKPIIQITEPGGANNNKLFMEVTHLTFFNTNPSKTPVWLETEIVGAGNNVITSGDLLRIDVDPALPASFTIGTGINSGA